jgi:hypothetical protein
VPHDRRACLGVGGQPGQPPPDRRDRLLGDPAVDKRHLRYDE